MAKKTDAPKKDQHASNRLVRLPEEFHDLLKDLAKKNQRPLTWELRVALLAHFKTQGVTVPPGLE